MNYAVLFQTKFARVHVEIDALRSEVRLQKGAWIFTRHVHTREALLESPRFDRIHSICKKIGDDVQRWIKQNQLPDEGINEYNKARERVGRDLRSVNKVIVERRPTHLETWLSV